jgi:hypothetical protein
MGTGSTKQMEGICRRAALIQEETAAVTWRHVASQSNNADLISRGIGPTNLSTSILWWKGPQCLSQKPFSWPTTEFNTPTDNLEIRNVHVTCLETQEDITQIFSKMKKTFRVIAYRRRFIHNCKRLKAKRHPTSLSTQDLDQALTCCVKLVQQIPYAQEMKNLMEQEEFAASRSLKTIHSLINKELFLRVEGRL